MATNRSDFGFLKNLVLFTLAIPLYVQAAGDKGRERVEQLIKWRVSDQLALSPKEEEAFSKILLQMSEKRRELNDKLNSTIESLRSLQEVKSNSLTTVSKKKQETLALEYEKLSLALTELHRDENMQLKKLFGLERFGRYLVLRHDLNDKLKEFITSGRGETTSPKKRLPEPQIIEEATSSP